MAAFNAIIYYVVCFCLGLSRRKRQGARERETDRYSISSRVSNENLENEH